MQTPPVIRRAIAGLAAAALLGLPLAVAGPAAGPADAAGCTARVALTFDDGPSTYRTQTLRTLRRKHAPATFFDLGVRVHANPQLTHTEAADGHVVLSHTWGHPDLTTLTPGQIDSEVTRTEQALADAGAPLPFKVLRPPFGVHDPGVDAELARLGYHVAPTWDDSVNDWVATDTPDYIRDVILSGLHPGAIILLHDGAIDTSNGPADEAALPSIIDGIRAAGYCLGQLNANADVVPTHALHPTGVVPAATNPVPYRPLLDGGTPPDPYVIVHLTP